MKTHPYATLRKPHTRAAFFRLSERVEIHKVPAFVSTTPVRGSHAPGGAYSRKKVARWGCGPSCERGGEVHQFNSSSSNSFGSAAVGIAEPG